MWRTIFQYDPIPALLTSADDALFYNIQRDLLAEDGEERNKVWESRPVERIVRSQNAQGYWEFPGKQPGKELGENYRLIQTWKMLRLLVGKYALDRDHRVIQRAAEYVFSCQTEQGDIRGILSNQYIPYYNGVILELLIQAGYGQDERVLRALDWLLDMRQNDGGWIIPANMYSLSQYYQFAAGEPIPPRRESASSHMATGMVLRAFCRHPRYNERAEVLQAAGLLASRLFQKDTFTFRQAPAYWFKLQYPFWWTTLLSALDTLARCGFDRDDVRITKGLDWFIKNQTAEGLWLSSYEKTSPSADAWVTFAVCRMAKLFFDNKNC